MHFQATNKKKVKRVWFVELSSLANISSILEHLKLRDECVKLKYSTRVKHTSTCQLECVTHVHLVFVSCRICVILVILTTVADEYQTL